jgi:hypothetical protein
MIVAPLNRLPALLLLSCVLATAPAMADVDVTLRGAAEPAPSKQPWTKGAGIAYTSIDGASTTDIDAVLALNYRFYQPLPLAGEDDFKGGSIGWTASAGPYLHKHRESSKPTNDRGATISFGANWIPRHFASGSGAVVSISAGLTIEAGKTLSESGTGTGHYVDVDKQRTILSGSVYYDPVRYAFLRLTLGGYTDKASDAPAPALNGRESGTLAGLDLSIYPLGRAYRFPNVANGLIPLLTFSGLKQWDASASGQRQKRDYRLGSATLSFLFAPHDSAFVPSLDISRSFGANLLEGRERSGKTSVRFSVKY